MTSDEHVSEMKAAVISIIKGIDERINMHDFRVVTGPTHTNIIFDVLIPYKFQIQDDELAARITSQVRERLGNNYSWYQSRSFLRVKESGNSDFYKGETYADK